MNKTLKRLKAEVQQSAKSQIRQVEQQKLAQQLCSEAARPLFRAFEDVRGEFVRIDVMRQIWPYDYQQRDDRASGLICEVLGDDQHPCGLKLSIPGGSKRFEAELLPDGSISFVTSRETAGTRPHYMTFSDHKPWLESFYKTLANLLEL